MMFCRIRQNMLSGITPRLGLGNRMSDPRVCVVFWGPGVGMVRRSYGPERPHKHVLRGGFQKF